MPFTTETWNKNRKEWSRKISIANKGKKRKPTSEKTKQKISKSNKIALKRFYLNNPNYRNSGMWEKGERASLETEWKKGVKNSVKFTKEVEEKRIKNVVKGLCNRPTSYEKKISELCFNNNLPFIYTGDGRFLINFKNPDFVDKNNKIAIEVFYSWFKIRDYGSVENYKDFCKKKYNSVGWRVIFIDENSVLANNWEELCLNKLREQCHSKTNYNRSEWIAFFGGLI